MTEIQRLQVRASKLREGLNALLFSEEDSLTEEQNTELTQKRKELTDVERRWRIAVSTAPDPKEREKQTAGDTLSSEQLEFAALEDAVVGGQFLLGKAEGQAAEYRQALGLSERCLPWGSLLNAEEKIQLRADAYSSPPSSGEMVNQSAILQKIMEQGVSSFLYIDSPSVPVGTASYPHVSGAATAAVLDKAAESDAAAVTVAAKELKPKRVLVRVGWSLEDEYSFPGFAEALTMEARRILTEKLDSLPLKGQDADPTIEGLSRTLDAPTAPVNASTYTDLAQLFVPSPPWSYDFSGPRLVTHRDLVHYLVGVVSSHGELLWDPSDQSDPRLGSRIRVSNFIDAPDDTTKVGELLRVAGPAARGRCVMPVWANLEILDDLTRAKTGQRLRTLISLANVGIIDSTPWSRQALKTT